MMIDQNLPATIVNVSSLADKIDISNTSEVRQYLFNHFKGREILIKSDGNLAFFGRNGLSDSLKRKNAHRQVFSALDKIIENSYFVGFQKVDPKHAKKRPDLRGQFIYAALINLRSMEQPELNFVLSIKLDYSAACKTHLYFKDISLMKMRSLYAGQTENPNANLPADRTVLTIHDITEVVKQKFQSNPLFLDKKNILSGESDFKTIINSLGKGKIMQTTPEMYQLSPLELTLAIRASEAQNSLEYMYLVCKSGTIRAENQLDAMHLTSLMKNNPDLLQNAKNVLEVRREVEFHKLIGKQETPVEKTAGQTVEKISGQAAEKSVQQPEVKKEYKSSLLVALKYAVDVAVYRARAAIMAINNAALKNSLSALEKVQVQVSQLEQLKDKELVLQQQISGEAAPAQIEPTTATAKADDDLLSPKVTPAESAPVKKETTDSPKMKA